ALVEYDRNGDGFLDAAEIERCPALKSCLKTLDKNKDGRLSADEIAARVTEYKESRIGLLTVSCQVTLDGAPLAGAAVEFVPEKFLGPVAKSASGVTDARGSVTLRVAGQELPGVPCGFYRVTVSKKNAGKETVPERYNAKTVLGREVGPDLQE